MPRKPIQKVKLTKKIDSKKADEPIINIDLTEDHVDRVTIEKIANFKVNNLALYQRALVHISIETLVNKTENKSTIRPYLLKSNENMEFLGDNILKAVMAEYLFRRFPSKDPKFYSKVKTRMENTSMFCHFAEQIGIDGNLLVSGQAMSVNVLTKGMPQNEGVLEDAFEAFVGAIFLDFGEQGFLKAREFALNVFDRFMDDDKILKDTNYKDRLIRYCNNIKQTKPEFFIREARGEAHDRTFILDVYMFKGKRGKLVGTSKAKGKEGDVTIEDIKKFGGELYGTGTKKTKKAAEQAASYQALKKLRLI